MDADFKKCRAGAGRRGSIYVLILFISLIVTVIGLSTLVIARVERREAQTTADLGEARSYAVAAIEYGLYLINLDPSGWRTTFESGPPPTDIPFGDGTFSLVAVDPVDSDIDNNDTDPLVMTGTGTVGYAVHKTEVTVEFSTGSPQFDPGTWKQVVVP